MPLKSITGKDCFSLIILSAIVIFIVMFFCQDTISNNIKTFKTPVYKTLVSNNELATREKEGTIYTGGSKLKDFNVDFNVNVTTPFSIDKRLAHKPLHQRMNIINQDNTSPFQENNVSNLQKSNTTNCSFHKTKPNTPHIHNLWHVTQLSEQRLVYATKSYYDDRPLAKNGPFIRMVVVSGTNVSSYMKTNDMYCHVWMHGKETPFVVKALVTKFMQIVREEINGTRWMNTYISCPLSNGLLESNMSGNTSHVSLTDALCRNASTFIPVIYPQKPKEFEQEVGMCFGSGTLYGSFNDEIVPWLIEWFESVRMFGINEFNINNGTLQASDKAKKLLDNYQKEGVLNLIQLPPPLYEYGTTDQATGNIAMRIAINDCLFMNMYRYKYLAVFDYDEIIVPHEHNNYHDMLTQTPIYIEPCKGCGNETSSITFSSRLYCLKYPMIKSNTSDLVTASHRIHHNVTGSRKNFINPRLCKFIWTHGCIAPIEKGIAKSVGRSEVSI